MDAAPVFRPKRWLMVAAIGVVAALMFGWAKGLWHPPGAAEAADRVTPKQPKSAESVTHESGGSATESDHWAAETALRYARAVQNENCEEVIGMTAWMADRLKWVQLHSGDPDAVARARQQLRDGISRRVQEGNQLRPEGVEDQYVFAPDAVVTVVGMDKGNEDIPEVRERVWMRVTYPERSRALLDLQGLPIRTLTVGVNLSADGRVVKAGIVGNLDLDMDSITHMWSERGGQ